MTLSPTDFNYLEESLKRNKFLINVVDIKELWKTKIKDISYKVFQ